MSKHTPGPWTIEHDASECVVSRDPEANEFHIVARTYGPDDAANARLIAAAPELLRALKHAQEALYWHKGEDFEMDGRQARDVIAAAIAIAKAEGAS